MYCLTNRFYGIIIVAHHTSYVKLLGEKRMKIVKIGEPEVIMSNPGSRHCYFGWPTVTRLQNKKIAVVASGYRLRHVCPFGKCVISYSEDEGKTYTKPAVVIDTVLDDRDGGIMPFGKSSVIVTSFNNTVNFQRSRATGGYDVAYLDLITPEEEALAIGSNFRISQDCGVTFGEIFKSPVTSPHGPTLLKDGTILWVGRTFSPDNTHRLGIDKIEAHKINPDGSTEYVGEIENIQDGETPPLSCEPHAIQLDDGTLLAHIRVHNKIGEKKYFTIFQSKSNDGGVSWSKPVQILENFGGAPAHLFKHSSGMLISTYSYRNEPYGIKVMFSSDNGNSWETGHYLYSEGLGKDLGYPSTVELSDGSLLTVFYACTKNTASMDAPTVIMQQRWRLEK